MIKAKPQPYPLTVASVYGIKYVNLKPEISESGRKKP